MRAGRWIIGAVALTAANVAHAAVYRFTISGAFNATFEINGERTPDSVEDGLRLTFYDVPGFPGTVNGIADVEFYTEERGGGLYLVDFGVPEYIFAGYGQQLYTGSQDAPSYLTGTFTLFDYWGKDAPYTLTVAQLGVPEPASWAMMIGGLGMLGASARRRRPVLA